MLALSFKIIAKYLESPFYKINSRCTTFVASTGFFVKLPSRTCKPGSVVRGHLSTPTVADRLKRYSRLSSDGQPYVRITQTCIGRGLHGTGRYRPVGELLPRLSILTSLPTKILRLFAGALKKECEAVYFCCTFLEVAFT